MSEKSELGNPNQTGKHDAHNQISQQYGGIHSGSWVDHLPKACVPYIQLCRLSPPAALFLIYLPHFYGAMHAAKTTHQSPKDVFQACGLLFGGSFFYSNAAHSWNDLIDAPIDRQVARTKNRPIARGTISRRAALLFTISQALSAAAFLLLLPRATAITTIPSIVGATYYPWAKLHTHFPQLVLGTCLAWGTMVGASTLGIQKPWEDVSGMCLVTSLILWTSIYDTVYAHQDKKDDMKIGVKSTAVLFQHNTRKLLWVLLGLMSLSLLSYGWLTQTGAIYYAITFGGSVGSLGAMIHSVDLDDESSCWWWFSSGFWFTGISLSLGLALEYGILYLGY
ncbi:prenyltransferase [Xylariaceae sp. FL1019]|nr:prenyltransferase [Xylariaceae sp. FL1019]